MTKFYEKLHEVVRVQSPGSYENSGIIALINGDKAGIYEFGHCSCSGTYHLDRDQQCDSQHEYYINQGELSWAGSKDELKNIAENNLDWNVPGRNISALDFDYKRAVPFLAAVRQWFIDGVKTSQDIQDY